MVTQKQLAEAVIARLREAGHEALLAGGCVRDLLLGRPPKDYDVATSARPEQVMALFPKTIAVGAAFGVVVVIDEALQIEVATFRSDAGYTDGRRPDHVAFTDAQHDALRRDFTINGLFLDPRSGEVLDYVGGRKDLEGRIIRAIGRPQDRFAEDHLRMLRAVRFSAELGFEIERDTAAAVRQLAPKVALVSGERVAAELQRILTALPAGRRRGLELMDSLGLMAILLPEIYAMHGTKQGLPFHPEGDVFTHTILCVGHLREPTFELALAGLFHDLGKPSTAGVRENRLTFYGHEKVGEVMAEKICGRLHLSTLQMRRVMWLVRSHMKLMCCDEMREARLKRLFAEDGFEELAELWRADCLGSGGTAEAYESLMARYRAMGQEEVKPAALVTGDDLIRMGLAPGPRFREILDQVYDAQLEGRAASKEEAVALARQIVDRPCNP